MSSNLTDPGRLNRRIVLQSPTATANALGEVVQAWTTQASVWASFIPEKITESDTARQEHAQRGGIFRVYRSTKTAAATAQWRILHGSDQWKIRSVVPVEEPEYNVYIDLHVTRRADG